MADRDEEYLEHLCERLANQIHAEIPHQGDYAVRADAGDPGLIYVALRGAKRDRDAGEQLADRVSSLLDRELAEEPRELEYALSMGAGNKDLLLQVDVREG